jgi:hypothetical protein
MTGIHGAKKVDGRTLYLHPIVLAVEKSDARQIQKRKKLGGLYYIVTSLLQEVETAERTE